MTGKTWLKWDQIWPRQNRQEKCTKKPPNQTKKNPQKTSSLERCSSPEESPQVEACAKRQSALQGAKRRQNFSQERSSFSTAPTLHFQWVCPPEAWPYISRQQSSHHCTHLLSHTSVQIGPDCQSCHLPLRVSLPLQWQNFTRSLYQQRAQLSQHCTSPLNCPKSGV